MEDDSDFKQYHFKYFIISFLIIFIISFLVAFYIENEYRNLKIEELKRNEERIVALENDFIGRELRTIMADLHYLHHAFENYLDNEEYRLDIVKNWSEFSAQRRIYDQIRFIDNNGDEKIRINLKETGAYAVSKEELQNKKDRYYFYETVKLEDNSVYISPLDLNMEQGKIEEPYKPMIRFSSSVYRGTENLKGIIVLNYLADNMLESFRDLGENSQGEIVLLNSKGFWLSSEDTGNDWNFMFPDRMEKTFSNEYPREWEEILAGSGQVITEQGLFTFTPVNLSQKINEGNEHKVDHHVSLGDGNWYILSLVSNDGANAYYFIDNTFLLALEVLNKNKLYFSLIAILSGFLSLLVYFNRKNYNKIKYYSEFDSLTKILNRRAGMKKFNNLFIREERRDVIFSLCFIDINGLKQVNDILGHRFGDELIVTVAEVIKRIIREEDFVMRLGGDEFLIVLKGINKEAAESVWQRIVKAYNNINTQENRPYIISVSHGIIDCDNNYKLHFDDLISKADDKMYEEKKVIKAGLQVIKNNL